MARSGGKLSRFPPDLLSAKENHYQVFFGIFPAINQTPAASYSPAAQTVDDKRASVGGPFVIGSGLGIVTSDLTG